MNKVLKPIYLKIKVYPKDICLETESEYFNTVWIVFK
jgi:hypothetical protein